MRSPTRWLSRITAGVIFIGLVAPAFALFPAGTARTAGPHGWWSTRWTATIGDGFSGEPQTTTHNHTVLVRYTHYTVCYDLDHKIPVWAAYSIDRQAGEIARDELRPNSNPKFKRPGGFSPEPILKAASKPLKIKPARDSDYGDAIDPRYPISPRMIADDAENTKQYIQRGHVVPNNAMKCTGDEATGIRAQKESFSLANIVPQMNEHNAPAWSELEEAVLRWSLKYDRVWVIGGPVVTSKPASHMKKRITRADTGIVTPDAMFYVVRVKEGAEWKTAAFVLPHKPENLNFRLPDYVKSVDDVELMTGLNFFPELGEPTAAEQMKGTWLATVP